MRAHRHLLGAALLAVSITTAVVGIALILGTDQPPPDAAPEPMRCVFHTDVDVSGPPAATAGERVARRVKRFCMAMGATPPPAPPASALTVQRVNARRFCLELATQGTPIAGVDCGAIPTQAVYYDREDH